MDGRPQPEHMGTGAPVPVSMQAATAAGAGQPLAAAVAAAAANAPAAQHAAAPVDLAASFSGTVLAALQAGVGTTAGDPLQTLIQLQQLQMAQAANVQQVYISGADDRADGGAAIGAAQGAAAAAPRGWSDAFDELMSVRPPLSAKQKSDVLQMVALQRLAPSEEEKRCKIMDRLLTIENYWPGPPASAECSSESEPEEIEAKPKLKKRRPAPAPAPAAAGGGVAQPPATGQEGGAAAEALIANLASVAAKPT